MLNETPESTPQPAPIAEPTPQPSKTDLTPQQAATMIQWASVDLAAGKITQAQAAEIHASLQATPEQIALQSAEAKALDQEHGKAGQPKDFVIRYAPLGSEAPLLTASQREFDTSARTWLSGAGFPVSLGNSLVGYVDEVSQRTQNMSEEELQTYGETEYKILEKAHGSQLQGRLEHAAQMIDDLERQRPGLKALLKSRGVGDNSLVVNLLIQQARGYHARRGKQ